jgi:DNA-binding transcriptional MerR regulator
MPNDIEREVQKLAEDLIIDRKRSIGEVAKELKVETHVVRFWEEKFSQIKPEIGAGKRRYYYNKQLKVLKRIKQFLYEEGYTINGLQKLLKKRKSFDGNHEEDLDTILSADFSEAEKLIATNQESKNHFTLNDFIAPNRASNPDLKGKKEIEESLTNIRQNLQKLKSLLN